MRWLLLALFSLFAPICAQFWDFGSNNNEDDSYADQFGFKESINQWSDVLKKMAHKNIFGAPTPPPSEFQRVAPPPDVDKIDPKTIQSQKHDIINAKLLDLILPRFKGEAPLLLRPSTTATEPPKKEIVTKPNLHKPTKKLPTTTSAPEDEDEEDEEDIDDDEDDETGDDDDDEDDQEESEEKPKKTTKNVKPTTKAKETTTVTITTPSTTTTASTPTTSTTTIESSTTTTESTTPTTTESTTTTTPPSTTTTVTFETTKKIVEIIEQTLSSVGKVEESTKMTSPSTTISTTTKSTTPKTTISSKPTTKKLNIVFHTAAKEKFDNAQKKVVKRNDSPKNSTNPFFDSQLEAKVRKMMKEIFEKEFKKKIDNSSLELRHELQKHKDELLKTATEHLSILNGNSIIADLANKWTDKMGSTTKQPVKEGKIEKEITTEKAETKAVTLSTVKTTIKPKSTTVKTTTTAEKTKEVKVAEPEGKTVKAVKETTTPTPTTTTTTKKQEATTPTTTTTTKKQEPTTTTGSTTVTTTAKTEPTTVKTTKKTTPKPKTDEESGLTVVQAEDEPDTELDEKDKQKLGKEVEKEKEKEKEKVIKLAESEEVEPTTVKAKKTKKVKRHKKRKVTTTTPEPEEDDDDDEELDEADIDEIEEELKDEKSKMKLIRAKDDDEVKADEKRKKQTPADRSAMKVIKAVDLMSGETKDDIVKPKRKEAEPESEEENDEEEVEGSAGEDLPIEKTITAENDGDEDMDETPLTGENEEQGSGIPEAEEEDVTAEVKEDKNYEKLHDAVTEAVPEDDPTTTTTAKPANQTGQNIFNLQANANSDANPNVANVITPVAGIIDGLAPILFPFLQSRGFSARAAAQGAPLFQPDRNENSRDLLENSEAETSLVGLSSQLAREILQPGSLRKEREEMETLLRKKAEEAKAKLAERERERLDFEAKQEAMKRQLLEQERRMRFSMQNNPMVQQAFAAPSMNMEKVFEEAAAETFKQETDPPQSPSVYSITAPPGIQSFRTPPPPPPGYRPKGYDGPLPPFPAFTAQNENKEVEEIIGGTTKETPFQQFPTPNPSRVNARSLSKEKLSFLQQMKANRQNLITDKSEGFGSENDIEWENDGSQAVGSTFVGDSGLLTRNSGTPPPGADFSNSFGFSGGDAGTAKENPIKPEKRTPFAPAPSMPSGTISFGGGKRPTFSFDEVEKRTDKGGMDFFGR